RMTLAGLNRFQTLTGSDPFDLFRADAMGPHLVEFFWALASVDHADLDLDTAWRTFTPGSLLSLHAEMAAKVQPTSKPN
ncbi:MAG TPA: hypothetical protein VFD66_07000, partial [Verrucomicrobiae bacterium]|nr:hypothetical protein [Verrucomicrobiae bacterium]